MDPNTGAGGGGWRQLNHSNNSTGSIEAGLDGSDSVMPTVSGIRSRWRDGAFVAGWEFQSQVSSIVLVAFARFGSLTSAIPVMLLWSLLTTLAFHHARLAGRPDLLERTSWGTRSRVLHVRLLSTGWTALKAWLAGIQAFLYTRLFRGVIVTEAHCLRSRVSRFTVLGVGLTIFGVPTAHHLLRTAGYQRESLLRLGFLAAFLNVPFRVVASGIVVNFMAGLIPVHVV
jgi:hypothetical protein